MKDLKISKELLSEVLKMEVVKHSLLNKSNKSFNVTYMPSEDSLKSSWTPINIYEFAFKCKEWAYNEGYLYWYENNKLFIKIMYSCKVDFEIDIGEYKKPFEIDIDFKACQWILDNKDIR